MQDQIRNDEMRGTCSKHEANDKYLQKVAQEVARQKITQQTQAQLKRCQKSYKEKQVLLW
jgi:hypothetical protein